MDGILEFAKNNYLIFLILGIFFVLALIGYLYDKHQNKDIIIKSENTANNNSVPDTLTEEIKPEVKEPNEDDNLHMEQ